ncbi:CGNR zinc finger domain-containing protein [Fodinicola feengrottensis]|uniref:CGNR zinc finger domain-containing protein n=1 Tax=Fodinicola feengrottensis TaxID=435914 RepID=A0ABN2GVQ3_9ACTN|nr:CGNR zinc finger domain-containing protein [Fodinicola feengrottensis]
MAEEAAPGGLEVVRTFLNSWVIPNDTREAEDQLETVDWAATYPDLAPPTDFPELRALRDDLRAALGQSHPVSLTDQLARHRLVPMLAPAGSARPVELVAAAPTASGQLLARVITAIADGRWRRLRACPDCRWVFYDTSRNGSRTWCAMTAGGPFGRGCGSIAKTRAYRARH